MRDLHEVAGQSLEWTQPAADVVVESHTAVPDLSFLVLLGWYLLVLMSDDAGGAAAAAAAG